MHPAAEVAIRERPSDEMDMVRHETIGEHPHRNLLAGQCDEPHEVRVVRRIVIDRRPSIAAIDDVVAEAADR